MPDFLHKSNTDSAPPALEETAISAIAALRRRLGLLRWVIPSALLLLVVAFEIGPSLWLDQGAGGTAHLLAEILLYGTVGPVLAFGLLTFAARWLEERETTDLQAQILARARERSQLAQHLNDDVLQRLFAVSLMLATFESIVGDLPPEAIARLREAEQTLDIAIRQLRDQLLDDPK